MPHNLFPCFSRHPLSCYFFQLEFRSRKPNPHLLTRGRGLAVRGCTDFPGGRLHRGPSELKVSIISGLETKNALNLPPIQAKHTHHAPHSHHKPEKDGSTLPPPGTSVTSLPTVGSQSSTSQGPTTKHQIFTTVGIYLRHEISNRSDRAAGKSVRGMMRGSPGAVEATITPRTSGRGKR